MTPEPDFARAARLAFRHLYLDAPKELVDKVADLVQADFSAAMAREYRLREAVGNLLELLPPTDVSQDVRDHLDAAAAALADSTAECWLRPTPKDGEPDEAPPGWAFLRRVVDIAWMAATDGQEVPSTRMADRIIRGGILGPWPREEGRAA